MKWISLILLWLLSVVAIFQYFFCPQYQFHSSPPFSGSLIYNPYEGADFTSWYKCNFHAHIRAWQGITNGKGTAAEACHRYASLNYDVYCISNYQTVEDYHIGIDGYVEAYEHGYGMLKNHHTVLGTTDVVWREYLFPQTCSNKQYILSTLSTKEHSVIAINHPAIRNAFPPDNFRFLRGFHAIELFPSGTMAAWDSALSSGQPIIGMANDDTHDIHDPSEVGRYCTWVGAPSLTKDNVLQALRSGRNYVMAISYHENETFEDKLKRIKDGLPSLKEVKVYNDTLTVSISDTAAIQFIGQNGKILSTQEDCITSSYRIKPEDTYVRTRIFFRDGNEIDLNAVYRYDGRIPMSPLPEVNITKTWLLRVFGIIILGIITFWIFRGRLIMNKKPRRREDTKIH